MTPEQLAARWLADVPRYVDFEPGATNVNWLREPDVIAAIARHLAPGDELVAQATAALEGVTDYSEHITALRVLIVSGAVHGKTVEYSGDDALAMTDHLNAIEYELTSRLARISALTATVERRGRIHKSLSKRFAEANSARKSAEAENAQLRDRLARMEGALTNLPAVYAHQINTGVREVYDPLQRFFSLESVLSALTDGDSNG